MGGGFGRQVLGENLDETITATTATKSTRGVIAKGVEETIRLSAAAKVFGLRPMSTRCVCRCRADSKAAGVRPGALGHESDRTNRWQARRTIRCCPIAWIKTYEGHSRAGTGRAVFTTTIGAASQDLLNEGLRRLLVNAAYWCVGLDVNPPCVLTCTSWVDISRLGSASASTWKGLKPAPLRPGGREREVSWGLSQFSLANGPSPSEVRPSRGCPNFRLRKRHCPLPKCKLGKCCGVEGPLRNAAVE